MTDISELSFYIFAQNNCTKIFSASSWLGKSADNSFRLLIVFYFKPILASIADCIFTICSFCHYSFKTLLYCCFKKSISLLCYMIAIADERLIFGHNSFQDRLAFNKREGANIFSIIPDYVKYIINKMSCICIFYKTLQLLKIRPAFIIYSNNFPVYYCICFPLL